AGTNEDVALAALRLDDLLDVEHGALVRSDGRPRRQNAPNLVRALAGNVAIAGVGCQHESVDDPGIAAVRDLDVGESRIEGQLVASLAVVPERDGRGIDFVFRLHELVTPGALQHFPASFSV